MIEPCPEHDATRERLANGSLLESARAHPPPGVRLRSDAELEQSLEDTLRHHDPAEDLRVFGYGSLMWNPAMDAVQTSVARVQGWHRSFCLRMLLGRGTPETRA
jgi:cation transport protein ChaC